MRKKLLNGILFTAVLVMFYSLLFGTNGVIEYNNLVSLNREQESQNNQMLTNNYYQQQNVELLKKNNLNSYESFIRRNLNYVKPGEVLYRIQDTDVLPKYEIKAKATIDSLFKNNIAFILSLGRAGT